MFRATKPAVPRAKPEKCSPSPGPEASPVAVPSALVRNAVPQALVKSKVREENSKPVASSVTTPGANTNVPPPPKEPKPLLPRDVTMDDVQSWEKALQYRPFYAEDDDDEDLSREVREDRKILPGHDPLISKILELYPEGVEQE